MSGCTWNMGRAPQCADVGVLRTTPLTWFLLHPPRSPPRRRYIVGGRYGLASKEFTPSHAVAVYENLDRALPMRDFSVGIVDDVTQRSLPPSRLLPEGSSFLPPGTFECLFWGMGSDGTVGANKEAIKIIASNTDMHTQVGC